MLFEFTDEDTLHTALLARDAGYDGRALGSVSSSVVFCRLSCPARKPKPAIWRFVDSVAACVGFGFRPCRRCDPLAPATRAGSVIATLLAALDGTLGKRWGKANLVALGLDPSTVPRALRRHFGMASLDFTRLSRLHDGCETLSAVGQVIGADCTQTGCGARHG